ncbi:hypothetical protein P6P90_07310 [Ectobacillus antri]|jgi:hypothetical protein|uniref:Uncharacterized protein n=1 Tax=Ectobacillus antri TaxID=2486280 RepID=A0ABT6H306_9BACI|nr:hypothetical protein [Ectobacillus antri]MDG4657467.1 hypothetical protein [Ectobacillus antri]MDG5753780.1 hypothetical protein [Ectobacillus antri]
MAYVFPTLLSSVLLFLILYVIKFNLTTLGHVIISCIAFCAVMLFLLLQYVIPLWQSILFVVLFIGSAVYILYKQAGHFLFREEELEHKKGDWI